VSDVLPAAFDLSSRRALVTGASRGIGRAIAVGLAAVGAEVLVHFHRDDNAAADVKRTIEASGGKAQLLKADLTEPGSGGELAGEALTDGGLDILVLNAAIQIRRPLDQLGRDVFDAHINANFWSALQLLQATLPGMIERGWGRILAIGSVQQVRPNPNLLVYSGLKSALSTVIRSLAKVHARSGITANTLAPGLIETDRNDELRKDEALLHSVINRIPMGAAGTPQDCVGAALLLCSDAGRYVTGVDLLVDGGMHLP